MRCFGLVWMAAGGLLVGAGGLKAGEQGPPALEGPKANVEAGIADTEQPPPAPRPAVFDWRVDGPPADHPEDLAGPAPDPRAFYVPGHYAPEGDRLVWVKGFWARIQAGWDWVPARFVRMADGWDYREGYWTRDPVVSAPRYNVARPRSVEADSGLPPAIVELRLGSAEEGVTSGGEVVEGPLPPVVVGPRGRRYFVPYRPMVEVRARRLYDPYGVVGETVPPFVRNMLDRILP